MQAHADALDAIASNLANLSTPGYKREIPAFSSYLGPVPASAAPQSFEPVQPNFRIDLQDGPVRQTGNPFDLALRGPGFFAVQFDDTTAYTRNGAFTLDREGYLVTATGHRLLGEQGPIQISGTNWQVSDRGEVTVEGETIGRLRLVNLPAASLQRIGESLFLSSADPQTLDWSTTELKQAYLEQTNASAVWEMVSLIGVLRSFEASQRLIQAQDETLGQAVGSVGQV
jgi:flagellar basal-body rod protein FlgG